MNVQPEGLEKLLKHDGYLEHHKGEITRRYTCFRHLLDRIKEADDDAERFCRSYKRYGLQFNRQDNSVDGLEWAPGAQQVYLKGDFNDWNETSHPYEKLPFGKWQIKVAAAMDGEPAIKHLSKLKLVIKTQDGQLVERISPWASCVKPPPNSFQYEQVFWNSQKPYKSQGEST